MISDRALDAAVADGVISLDQVASLRAIELRHAEPVRGEETDDESLRFVTGFADIFVTIGIVLFLGALAFLMGSGLPMLAGIALSAWLLAEFFTYKRRMALPSIALLVAFAGTIFMLALQIATVVIPSGWRFAGAATFGEPVSGLILAAFATAVLCAVHYLRFRVPITIAAGVAALCVLAVAIILAILRPAPREAETVLNATLFVCGLVVFALAMRFDMSDPQRLTRRTDIAFWLHLLAAPLIVHPLIRGFLHGFDTALTTNAAIGILCVFAGLALVAVVVDRRAMLVSGLVYAGIASATLIRSLGLATSDRLVPIVLLALGAFILLLSAGWQPLRRALLRRLPGTLAARLPHPLAISRP